MKEEVEGGGISKVARTGRNRKKFETLHGFASTRYGKEEVCLLLEIVYSLV